MDRNTNVQVLDNGNKIKHTNEQSQMFKAEDYVQVFNDTIQNMYQLQQQLERIETQIEKTLDENNDEMGVLHTIAEGESQSEEQVLEADSVTVEDFKTFQELQQQKQQREQLMEQENRLNDQIESMRGAAERVADNDEIKSLEDFKPDEEPEETSLTTEE